MKKFLLTLVFFFMFIPITFAKEINIYLFYGESCPHCKELHEYLDKYLKDKENIKLYEYEIYNNKENAQKLSDIIGILDTKQTGIPFLIIGNNVITGYASDVTDERIRNTINYYLNVRYKDKVGIYLGLVEDDEEIIDEKAYYQENIDDISAPGNLKKIIKKSPIFISAMLIGLVDGFNPCAMWILLFLISMLIGVKDKKRKWILGLTFILSSSFVYFIFLMSWLELSLFLNNIGLIRLGVATVAVILGVFSILKFIKTFNNDGCVVVNKENRKRIITTIKKIVREKSFIFAILGMIVLACSVNIIELLCSLGLPVIFTQLLALNGLSNNMKIFYCIVYVIFFMLDDLLVFFISMKTLELKAISNKYAKYSTLIGGIIMIVIGLLMIYYPEILMFNF